MLLQNKNAIVYGGGGAVGGAVARAFAREGARVFLAGRHLPALEAVSKEIVAAGGQAEVGLMNALDQHSVEEHIHQVIAQAGQLDISFNAISWGDTQGHLMVDMALERFSLPVTTAVQTHFFTTTAAARQMSRQKSGVILTLTANVARVAIATTGGFGVACAAVEALYRQIACEAGADGVRVVCLRSAGSPDAPGVREAFKLQADPAGMSLEDFTIYAAQGTLLKRLPLLAEVANAAVLMASDKASAITSAVTNVTCGLLMD